MVDVELVAFNPFDIIDPAPSQNRRKTIAMADCVAIAPEINFRQQVSSILSFTQLTSGRRDAAACGAFDAPGRAGRHARDAVDV